MGKGKRAVFFIFSGLFLAVSGCATGPKQSDIELQGLRNQVQTLEAQNREKDQEINGLKDALSRVTHEKEVAVVQRRGSVARLETRSRPTMRQIQMALRNAGFDPGIIDGRKGRKTKEAIRAFQKANGLSVDGRVGKRTWSLLSEYLEKKEK